MIVNVWFALRNNFQTLIEARFNRDDSSGRVYSGPITKRQLDIFRLMGDRSVQNQFRKAVDDQTLWARVKNIFRKNPDGWTFWSLSFESDISTAQNEMQYVLDSFPNGVIILGGWDFDTGEQVTEFPIHPRILEFMPDIVTYDSDGNEISRTRPVVPTDINLGLGQAPRVF